MALITNYSLLHRRRSEVQVFARALLVEKDSVEAKNIVSLWMWLETMGAGPVVTYAKLASFILFERLVAEAKIILDRIRLRPLRNPLDLNSNIEGVPLPQTVLYVHANRDAAIRVMVRILDGVGRVIFNEELIRAARDRDAGLTVEPRLQAKLFSIYVEMIEPTREDSRSILISYFRGHRADAHAIKAYFWNKWGVVVERVDLDLGAGEEHWSGLVTCYGKIVFQSPSFLQLVLEGGDHTLFNLGGWTMSGRRIARHFI